MGQAALPVIVVSIIFQSASMLFSFYSLTMIPKVIKNKKLMTLALLLEVANITFQLTGVINLFQPIAMGRNYLGSFLCFGVAILDLQIISLFAVIIPWLRGNRIQVCRVVSFVLYVFSNIPVLYYHILYNELNTMAYFVMLSYGFIVVIYDNIQGVYITTLIYKVSKNKTEKLAISFKESLSLNSFILFMDLLGCIAITGSLFFEGVAVDICDVIFDATIGNHVSLLVQLFKKIVKLKFADTITNSVRGSQIKSMESVQSANSPSVGVKSGDNIPIESVEKVKSSENVDDSSSDSTKGSAKDKAKEAEGADKHTENLKAYYKKEISQRNTSKIERRSSVQNIQ
ncbi:hypothetical protein HK103_004528 [Boothiomyces macroporosus]|uniref:Uncharacterized protein n=1 Tax=Boothiomyces macroporosus TaxID=261099 RepID=A0AAD5UJB1_9FUNG|nr:hypothetical protein HK103_004528 [Boothiomyces macroporosus]